MLQNPCKTLGFKKKMVYKIPPGEGGGKPYPASGLYTQINTIWADKASNIPTMLLQCCSCKQVYDFSLLEVFKALLVTCCIFRSHRLVVLWAKLLKPSRLIINNSSNSLRLMRHHLPSKKFLKYVAFPWLLEQLTLPILKCAGQVDKNYELYRNRKEYFSVNVQAVCSHDLKFTNIVTRWP